MSVRELIRYSNRLLRGRRAVTALICFMPVAAELFFRAVEACFYSILLYFGNIRPLGLFTGTEPLQTAITAGFTLLRWTVVAPLTYVSAHRLCEIAAEKSPLLTPLTDVLTGRSCVRRSLAAFLWTKLISLAALVPAAFFGAAAYRLFTERSGTASGLFITLHAVTLTVISVFMWLSLRISLTAVPYLLVRCPEKNTLRATFSALRLMRGRKMVAVRLFLAYIPAMLGVVTVPYAIAGLRTAFALSIDIFIKEEEYREGTETDSRRRPSDNAPELPVRTEGRFKASPDKA